MSDSSLIAVVGDDDFIVRKRAKEIFEELSDDYPDDLSREVIDGRADKVETVEGILQEAKSAGSTLSLFGGGKLVWLNEVNFLNQTKTGSAQGHKRRTRIDKTLSRKPRRHKSHFICLPGTPESFIRKMAPEKFCLRGCRQE
jgi:DNA polymerase III delta subunit